MSATQEDLDALGVEGKPQEGRVPIREFLKTGVYQVRRYAGDAFEHVRYADFVADPAAHPLRTASGKLEIYCEAISRQYDQFGLSRLAPIAKYVPAHEGYEDTFTDWNARVKGEYPFQNLSIHFIGRAHQAFDSVAQLRELFPHDVLMNELDARAVGVEQGQTVLVESPHGRILRRVRVTSLLIPGVVVLGEGSWSDVDESGVDRAGNSNTLESSTLSGEGQCTWNTSICRVLPWEGEPLPPDYRSADRRGAGIASVMPARKRKAKAPVGSRPERPERAKRQVKEGDSASPSERSVRLDQAKHLMKDSVLDASSARSEFGNAAKLRISSEPAKTIADLLQEGGDAR